MAGCRLFSSFELILTIQEVFKYYSLKLKTCPTINKGETLMKARIFKQYLLSNTTTFLMEAHSGLSAKLAEEAGFKALWASGLSMSASLGLRDSNEASWTQVTDLLEYMNNATALPILVDGDTGYGNFNNVRLLVKKLCQLDIAAVCIEDKIFPKTNSFLDRNQTLANSVEFCGKIKAGKDAQTNSDFSIVARTEALIAGFGMEEALERAEAYHQAGADAILIHSKKSNADEILEFAKHWNNKCPLVIVPTKYFATPTEAFKQANVSMVIWANHALRASIKAMRTVMKQIQQEESLIQIESDIASVDDIFHITNEKELQEAERLYLPSKTPPNLSSSTLPFWQNAAEIKNLNINCMKKI